MNDVVEALRLPSPAPRPQSLAFDGEKLWMGSIETSRIYAIDPRQWTIIEEDRAPGKPWGMAVVGDELRVICGESDEDNRIIRRFVPGHGFKAQWAIPCPDDTGSQLGYDGIRLYVSQWYNRCILGIDESGNVVRRIDVPRGICGQCYVDGSFLPGHDRRRGIERLLPHEGRARRIARRRRPGAYSVRGARARL